VKSADILADYLAWRKEPAPTVVFEDEAEREFARRYVQARLEEREEKIVVPVDALTTLP